MPTKKRLQRRNGYKVLMQTGMHTEVIEELLFEPELKMRGSPSPFERDVATEL